MSKKDPPAVEETESPETPQEQAPSADAEAWKDTALRAQADLVNFRNRTQREREQLWGEARADTITQFLPVIDNLERALEAPCSDETYKQGVELTQRQFVEILAKLGVAEIEALDKPFDPQMMDAVMHEEAEGVAESTVTQVFQKGYRIADRVLRHAVVKVAN